MEFDHGAASARVRFRPSVQKLVLISCSHADCRRTRPLIRGYSLGLTTKIMSTSVLVGQPLLCDKSRRWRNIGCQKLGSLGNFREQLASYPFGFCLGVHVLFRPMLKVIEKSLKIGNDVIPQPGTFIFASALNSAIGKTRGRCDAELVQEALARSLVVDFGVVYDGIAAFLVFCQTQVMATQNPVRPAKDREDPETEKLVRERLEKAEREPSRDLDAVLKDAAQSLKQPSPR